MRLAIAAAACTSLGLNLAILSASLLPTHPQEVKHSLKQCCREANLTGLVIFLDCDDLNREDANRTSAILQFVEGFKFLLIIGSQERQRQRERPIVTFEVGQLALVEKRKIWQSYLEPVAADLNGQVERLAAQFNLSPATIKAACLSVKGREDKSEIGEVLWDFCRTQSRPQLEDLAQRIETHATWEDLILPEEKKEILRDILTHVRQQAKVYEEWEFAKQGSRGLGITALFSGQSGTGKTMAAEVLAWELRLDLYRIDLSAVVSKYIGETEKNLRRIFDAAEGGGTILLFDEADALFGKRTQVKDSHDRHANVEVSYLLQRMEAYRGLAILTTNLKDSLDVAFLRRLRFSVDFPFPDTEARMQIWERIFPKGTPTDSLDFKKLSLLNASGGNIRSIALNAAFIAAEAREPVMMKHILQATQNEYVKLGRILTDREIRGWVRAGN
jgi:SpoVK/Ycf46/Vps4 family AAA+-type ATPase